MGGASKGDLLRHLGLSELTVAALEQAGKQDPGLLDRVIRVTVDRTPKDRDASTGLANTVIKNIARETRES